MLNKLFGKVKSAPSTPAPQPQYLAEFGKTIADFRNDRAAVAALSGFLRSLYGRTFWSALVNARPKGRGAQNKDISSDEICGQVTGYEAALSLITAMSFLEVSQKPIPETWEPATTVDDGDEQ
jgi:hypothetical protein